MKTSKTAAEFTTLAQVMNTFDVRSETVQGFGRVEMAARTGAGFQRIVSGENAGMYQLVLNGKSAGMAWKTVQVAAFFIQHANA